MNLSSFFRKDNPFDYIVLGFIIRLLGDVFQLFLSYHVTDALFGTICWIFIFQGISRIPEKLQFPFSGFYKFLIKFFLVLCLIMIIRGYMIDYNYIWFTTVGAINYHVFKSSYLICYLMPFVALIPIKYYNFRLVTLYSVLFIVITILVSFVYRNEIMQISLESASGIKEEDGMRANNLAYCGQFAILSLFYKYLPKRKWRIIVVGVVLCMLLMIVGARRGGTLSYSIFIVGAMYFYTSAKSGFSKFSSRIIVISGMILSFFYIAESSLSAYLLERGMTDTRSFVEDMMLSQMSDTELVFGKGLNGRYYCPLKSDDYLNGWRYVVETGFYNLVLKGGYLLSCSFLLILIIPMLKGWFRSKNYFCKAGAFFIMFHLISQKTFGILTFNLSFFFLWMMISCCMNKSILNMNDDEIKEQFFYNT